MAQEIERKFLVGNIDRIKSTAYDKKQIIQGYLCRDPRRVVRVRINGDKGYLTVKGITNGCSRLEFEYEIPVADAREMLTLCNGRIVSKTRYLIKSPEGLVWEIDEFQGDLAPLTVAEIELPDETTPFSRPSWLGEEVTGKAQYYNSNL